ncbi:flagellar FliJ family protein [Microbacterium sp. UFMG61]|uniref:flagellar FliJ family protein n=1 Tax=Microbacterium sp. UFMG61 TaxID=2745935 RepID=UPI00188E517F|nr:flagellar FliJ family protein [Microbacterium sp. UFMG61]
MTFPLAGLLRVRGAQERVAAERLSRATAERARTEAAAQDVRTSLADLGAQAGDAQTLLAMAAARAAGRSALSDLQALTELHRTAEDEAKDAHVEARRELKGLERLENTHRVEEVRADLAAEQTALDEIAVARAVRGAGSAA